MDDFELGKRLDAIEGAIALYSSDDGINVLDLRNELEAVERRLAEHIDGTLESIRRVADQVESSSASIRTRLDEIAETVQSIYGDLPTN